VKAREALRVSLDALLQARGKTRNQMVLEMGRSSAWISQILSGKRSAFLDKLDAISGYLDVEPAALFAGPPMSTPKADQHDDYTPTPPGTSTPAPRKSERTMLDEEERTILMGMLLGVIKHHPHAFTRLQTAIKDATDDLLNELRAEAQATQAKEAKVVGKN
jgi:transcriptional regulator with XRE-family HTH domain